MEQQGNSSLGDPMMAGLMISMARSYISTMIDYGFNEVSTNFDHLTSRISQEGKLLWNAILIACRLSMEVSRQTSMSMLNIILDGGENRFRFLKEATKKTGTTILTVGRTLRHVFMSYWDNSDPDAFDLLFSLSRYVPLDPNVNLQDVLDPILIHQETEPSAAEEHSNQSSSGNSNEESEDTESSEEPSNRSSSGQRTSNEESKDTGPSEEHSNQSSSSQSSNYYLRSSSEKSEDTESSEKHSNQSNPRTHNEESEVTKTSEEDSDQSSSDRRTSNEDSEEEHSEQSNSGGFWWIPY